MLSFDDLRSPTEKIDLDLTCLRFKKKELKKTVLGGIFQDDDVRSSKDTQDF